MNLPIPQPKPWQIAATLAIVALLMPMALQAVLREDTSNHQGENIAIQESHRAFGARDNVSPFITISNPIAGSTLLAGTIKSTGTAYDNYGGSGIRTVEVKVDNNSYKQATPKATKDWSTWTVSFSITTTGPHTFMARATDNNGNMESNTVAFQVTLSTTTSLDKFAIKKLFPTKVGGNEWYVNMADPRSDSLFKNLPTMTKQADGSWQVSASQVRMEGWSQSNEKWRNVEVTEYAKIISGSNQLLQIYSRGGHHTSSDPCLGSAYKARLYGDGRTNIVKEVTHPAYTYSKAATQPTTKPLQGRWIGFKAVIYNVVEDGKTYVKIKSYIDNDVTDSKGNLAIKNNWILASVFEDRGGWSTSSSDFTSNCAPLNKDNMKQYRQRDEIMNMPGGTSTQNIVAWRSDDLKWNWKYFSVREIQEP